MMEKIRIGLVGTGYRGSLAISRFKNLPNADLVAVCDISEDCVSKGCSDLPQTVLRKWGENAWKELCEYPGIDLIYICTPWQTHSKMAITALNCGKNVAVEVPLAPSIQECKEIINAVKESGQKLMMLENCIYDPFEAATQEMNKAGLFGDIYQAEGGYIHRLDDEQMWRKAFSDIHHGDIYPTHGAGPICRLMDIGGKDCFKTISSFETEFDGGIHTTSIIKTKLGKTIILQHNVHAMSPYSRLYRFIGTKGSACKYPDEHLALSPDTDNWLPIDVQKKLMNEYEPEWFETVRSFFPENELAKRFMDYAMDYRLMNALLDGTSTDMDIYDATYWSAISELSSKSIQMGGLPVEFPTF